MSSQLKEVNSRIWIALAIGNSRYHWAWFIDDRLQASWDTIYLTSVTNETLLELLPSDLIAAINGVWSIERIDIYLCSVVPPQTAIWQQLPQVKPIAIADIPLLNLYPTLGIDRALTLLGAGEYYGYPSLVIDGGTALTMTGVDANRSLVGGAIMPGLGLQLQSLNVGTAALPHISIPDRLPPRWGTDPEAAIASGVIHSLSAGIAEFISDWQRLAPDSRIVFTGGDGESLFRYLGSIQSAAASKKLTFDRLLIFQGFLAIYRQIS